MRGTFFLKGTEMVLTTELESWYQGDSCETTLHLKGDTSNLDGFEYGLYVCDLKKLKKKDATCLEPVESKSLSELKPQEENKISFELDENAPISDGAKTLCLFVGDPKSPIDGGLLQMTVHPWKPVTEMLGLFENFERFKIKSLKNKKDKLTAVLVPPGSKEHGNIDGLTLLIQRTSQDGLKLEFQFKIKKLAYEAGQVQTKAEKKTIKKELAKKELLGFGDSLNQDFLLKFFKEVLQETSSPLS